MSAADRLVTLAGLDDSPWGPVLAAAARKALGADDDPAIDLLDADRKYCRWLLGEKLGRVLDHGGGDQRNAAGVGLVALYVDGCSATERHLRRVAESTLVDAMPSIRLAKAALEGQPISLPVAVVALTIPRGVASYGVFDLGGEAKPTKARRRARPRPTRAEAVGRLQGYLTQTPEHDVTRDKAAARAGMSTGWVSKQPAWKAFTARRDADRAAREEAMREAAARFDDKMRKA